MENTFKPGDIVRIKHPTGGVRRDDEFVVIEPPLGRNPNCVWVRYNGAERWPDTWTRTRMPMGFDKSSLVLAS
jgi:signal peptidase I